MPRWRILLPASLLVTLATPALRVMPAGAFLPDPWLLLLLWAVPVPGPDSLRRPVQFLVLLGLLRSSVSAVSPFASLAGLALALGVRHFLHRRLVEQRFFSRFLVGTAAALPLAWLDVLTATRLGLEPHGYEAAVRACVVGVLWAAALRPAPLPGPHMRGYEDTMHRRLRRVS